MLHHFGLSESVLFNVGTWSVGFPSRTDMLVVFLAVLAFVVWKVFSSVTGGGNSSASSADFRSDKPYERKYTCSSEIEALPSETEAKGAKQGMPACKFLLTAKKHLSRERNEEISSNEKHEKLLRS